MGFLISLVIAAVSVFLLIVSIRYGVRGADRLDDYFSAKAKSDYEGFQWWFRIPGIVGMIPEYYYAMILGYDNYYTKKWWPLRIASYIAILLFMATLKSRSTVLSYYSFQFIAQNGFAALFTSGGLITFLNIITLMYIALFALICIESFKMHGVYAFARIAYYSILCVMMANLTAITLSVIVFALVIYIVFKIIKFLFFSSNKRKIGRKNEQEDEEESAGDILKGGFREFKEELKEWEAENKTEVNINTVTRKPKTTTTTSRKRPKITVKRKKTKRPRRVKKDDDIPRLHPD